MLPLLRLSALALFLPSLFAAPLVISVQGGGRSDSSALEAARDQLRAARRDGRVPNDGAIVELHGDFSLERPLELAAEDSGDASAPVTWRAAPGTRVHLRGSHPTGKFVAVTESPILTRLPAAARGQVLVTDLRAADIIDFGTITPRASPGLELFVGDARMTLARYPNDGWLLVADVPQTGEKRLLEGLDREKRFDGVPAGRHYGRIVFPGDRPAAWAPDGDVSAHGYWTFDWSDSYQRVQSFDLARHELTFAEPHHHYGYTRNQRFRFIGVLEELDQPGEWWIDRKAGKLYLWPLPGADLATARVSLLEAPLLNTRAASHVQFEGLVFEESRGRGAVITDGEAVQLQGCEFRNLGDLGVEIVGGKHHVVQSCDLHDLARGAIKADGGDRKTLTPGGHLIANNHVHHYAQWLRTGQTGIQIDGVGQRVANNLVHDAPFEAFYLRGNDHVLEFNEVHSTMRETGDAGAIHTGRDWTWQGNVIRSNYWHHLKGPGLHGVVGVYLDDFASGFSVVGNVFYQAGRAIQIGGGRDNLVANNLIVDCDPAALHDDARGIGWASNYFDGQFTWMFDRFRELNADQPPYVTRYPKLATVLRDEPAAPKGNRFLRNLSWGCTRWFDVYDYWAFDFHGVTEVRDNVSADKGVLRRRAVREAFKDPYYKDIDMVEGYVTTTAAEESAHPQFPGNTFLATPPADFDPVTLKFTPHDPALLKKMGFEPIPFERIGLQRDVWRRDVPARTLR